MATPQWMIDLLQALDAHQDWKVEQRTDSDPGNPGFSAWTSGCKHAAFAPLSVSAWTSGFIFIVVKAGGDGLLGPPITREVSVHGSFDTHAHARAELDRARAALAMLTEADHES